VRLTHPVRWSNDRLQALRVAAAVAGIPSVSLMAEPVAAAVHYGGGHVTTGEYVAVYDLGGGTFDTTVLRRTEDGFELAGPPGGDDRLGGEDFDHRLMDFVLARLAVTEPDAATALRESDDLQWRRAASQLLVESFEDDAAGTAADFFLHEVAAEAAEVCGVFSGSEKVEWRGRVAVGGGGIKAGGWGIGFDLGDEAEEGGGRLRIADCRLQICGHRGEAVEGGAANGARVEVGDERRLLRIGDVAGDELAKLVVGGAEVDV
jgi:hypothetical protein